MAMTSQAASQPPFPETVGKYELLLPIGTGGMATVYLAKSTGVGGFERDVALKLVHAHLRSDEESKLQLLEEAKLAARIRHPNVVPVLEVDEDPYGLFLVMDYVEGDTLAGLVREAKAAGTELSLRYIARILNDALLGLHAAHELKSSDGSPLNLVHRDFSPQNILISIQGATRLSDFGVAKAADRAVRTKTGLVKGKISYMSPEQARGHAIDRRCDVWAAGVVAWELIAGRRLHTSEDDVSTLLSIVTEHPPRLSDVAKEIDFEVPKALDDAIASALTVDVDERCPTAEELRLALEKAWEDCDGMATPQELGAFVTSTISAKLADRAQSVAEVRSLRQRMGQITRQPLEDQSQSSPRASGEMFTPSPMSGQRDLPAALDDDEELTRHEGIGSQPQHDSPSPEVQTEDNTEISAVVPAAPPKSSRSWLLVAAVMSALVGAFILFALNQKSEPSSASAAEPAEGAAHNPSQSSEEGDVAQSATAANPAESAEDGANQKLQPTSESQAVPAADPATQQTAKDRPRANAVNDPTKDGKLSEGSSKTAAKPRPKPRPERQHRTTKPSKSPPSRSEKPGLAQSPYSKSKSQ